MTVEETNNVRFRHSRTVVVYFFAFLIFIPFISLFLIQTDYVQQILTRKITEALSKQTGMKIEFRNVRYTLFHKLHLYNLSISNLHHDTLLIAPEVIVDLKAVYFNRHQIVLNQISFNNPYIKISLQNNGKINWYNFFQAFSRPDSSISERKKNWMFKFRNIAIEKAKVYFDTLSPSLSAWNKTILSNLVLRIKNLTVDKDGFEGRINRFGFIYNSNFSLLNLSTNFSYKRAKALNIRNFNLVTPESDIDLKLLSLDLTENLPLKHLQLSVALNMSKISVAELSLLYPELSNRKVIFRVKGEAKGTLSDLRVKNLALFTDEDNFFKGNIHYTLLPEISEPYLFVDVKDSRITTSQILKILSIGLLKDTVEMPGFIYRLKSFYFKGNFTGFPSDFVAFGTLTTSIGTIWLDASLKPGNKLNIAYNGTLEMFQFHIGELIGEPNLIGPTSLKLTAQGNIVKGKDVNGTLNLEVNNTSINGYPLQNIFAKGNVEKKIFQGKAQVNDPNLQIETSGLYSFSDSFPFFNFSAQIKKINLFSLHVLPNDSIYYFHANLEANFQGNNINEFDGNIQIKDILLKNKYSTLNIKNIGIQAFNNQQTKATVVSSDLFEMLIRGEYNMNSLLENLKLIVRNHIPSIKADPKTSNDNHFSFNLLLKQPQPLCSFFFPEVRISDSSSLKGLFNPNSRSIFIEGNFAYFQYKSLYLDNSKITVQTVDSSLVVSFDSRYVYAGEQIPFTKLKSTLNLSDNIAQLNISWYDSLAHLNEIRLKADSFNLVPQNFEVRMTLEPSTIYVRGEPWQINAAQLIVDTTAFELSHFQIGRDQMFLSVNGKISKNPLDSLFITFNDIDLNLLNYLLQTQNFHFSGKLDGIISISDIYKNKNITGKLYSNSFEINQTSLGDLQILARWNDEQEAINISINSSDKMPKIIAEGYILPLRRSYRLNFSLSNISLKFIEPLIEPTFLVQEGAFSGELQLTDVASKPLLNGKIEINDAKLLLTDLHTSYRFSNTLLVDNNLFWFKDFTLFDENQRPVRLNGYLRNTYLKNFSIDFSLTAENNLVFNKPAPDDLPFYGRAFASGKVRIYSNNDYITVDVTQAKTEENSLIYIALGQTYYASSSDFIQFVQPKSNLIESTKKFGKPLEENKRSRLLLNMDLDITPQAELQLLFSPQRGDMLRGRGSGSVKFEIDKAGNFFIRGQYTFSEGIYNFTMNNLMNKKFEILNSSTIFFNGRPTEATIDIAAVYHTRAALYNLLSESSLDFRKRIPVDCQLSLNGNLLEPNIRLSIDLPNASEETKSRVRSVINTEQEMSQQFLALLLLNNFIPTSGGNLQNKLQETNLGTGVATTTSLELLSSQLSSWISNLNKDLDIGISYRPGDQVYTNEDLEIAISTQLLNNRMSINSNIDIIGQSSNNTTTRQSAALVGDVNVEYKLTDRLSLKAFNRSNDILYFQDEIYTRGFGIIYREDFTSFKELTRRYFKQKQKTNDTIFLH
ncbi:MAG: translocation/assembly module TamB [Bacteroidales bacterium]|nr:translocation/assembly module TamB [Bacteroidales bacterium]